MSGLHLTRILAVIAVVVVGAAGCSAPELPEARAKLVKAGLTVEDDTALLAPQADLDAVLVQLGAKPAHLVVNGHKATLLRFGGESHAKRFADSPPKSSLPPQYEKLQVRARGRAGNFFIDLDDGMQFRGTPEDQAKKQAELEALLASMQKALK